MKNYFVVLLVCVLLASCTESKEKMSDPTVLLDEVENKLPESLLIKPDMMLQKEILSTAPDVKSFKKLTASIERKDSDSLFKVNKLSWDNDKVVISASIMDGILWYETYYKCVESGWIFCKSGYDVDVIMKLDSSYNNKRYYIYEVSEHPRKYSKKSTVKDKDGKTITKTITVTRKKADIPKTKDWLHTKYSLVFKDVPYDALRSFDLHENGCSESSSTWEICGIKIKYFDQEIEDQNYIVSQLEKKKVTSISIDGIEQLYKKYLKYDIVTAFLAEKILFRVGQKNSIEELHNFNQKYSAQKSVILKSIFELYKLIKIKDSVAGYEWFISNYSDSDYAKPSLDRIHEIMFNKAKEVDTIAAYNSFVFSYPTAKQVAEANEIANEKEKDIYVNLGLMSFWDKDHKKEKQARRLLIKAKQIERFPKDNRLYGKRKSGYLIVANRMYSLLQENFDDTDATLRYLESQDFKDFVDDFKEVMRNIQSTLDSINKNNRDISRYTKEMVQVSKDGFSDAEADRAMSAYYNQKHRNWEKQMHLQDKGYM